MWVSIRSRRMKISKRLRANIEGYVQRKFQRERSQLASVAVYLDRRESPGGEREIECRMVLWSHALGKVVVSEVDTTIRRAVGQASLRAREVVRRNLKRRITRNRRLTRNRLHRYFADWAEVAMDEQG